MAKLVGLSGVTAGREFPVGELCILGRSPNAHVRLPELAVSRQHAKITRVGNGFVIEDLESGYGTVVNSHYVTVSHLRPNDEIAICDFKFRFEDGLAERLRTSEYSIVSEAPDAKVISVDASRFTRFRPAIKTGDEHTISQLSRRLNAILAVGQAASHNPVPDALLEEVMGYCLEVFPRAERAMVATPVREKQSLVVQAMARRAGSEAKPLALSRNVMSEVLYKGRAVVTGEQPESDTRTIEGASGRGDNLTSVGKRKARAAADAVPEDGDAAGRSRGLTPDGRRPTQPGQGPMEGEQPSAAGDDSGAPPAAEAEAAGRSVGKPGAPKNRPDVMMVAPLICQGQMLGLVSVDGPGSGAPEDPTFNSEDLEVLTGMAAHIALALHAAQLRETLIDQSRTEQELTAAHEVQKRFLPRGVPKMAGFSFVAHYDPCRDVGGDLYDFINIDAGHLGVVIGDVSGKGFPAALVMAWVASQLRVAAHQERFPSDVVSRVNESLLEAHQDDLFVTLLYGVLDRWNRTFRFCNAGHVPPLVRRARDGRVDIVEQGGSLPVGVVAGASFEEHQIVLDQGDAVLLVTDGVTEAMDAERRMFGVEGLAAAMGQSLPPVSNMVSDVLGDLRDFVGRGPQYDDITIVAIGAGGTDEDVTMTLPPGLLSSDLVGE